MRTPAAQYLRISRNQTHSLEMQCSAINKYANEHGFLIAETYSDIGISGLTLRKRPGLRKLLEDVVSGEAKYKAVLVSDVSRWGRFQDSDEAAHYEFLCKAAKIPVHYCTEPFAGSFGLQDAVLKTLKRVMAAEYSREQSRKSFRGLKRIAEGGFRAGAPAGYGLRRMLVSRDGKERGILNYGQYKAVSTDRVILVPGPEEEVARVREIYHMALQNMSAKRIAQELNLRGVPYRNGKLWPRCVIQDILTNPKYAGWNVWNRTSKCLSSGYSARPIKEWVLKPNAFQALINQQTYTRVQQLRHPFQPRNTQQDLLLICKDLLRQHGRITMGIMEAKRPGLAMRCARRFGGLRYAYARLGCRDHPGLARGLGNHLRGLVLRDQVIADIRRLFPAEISMFFQRGNTRPIVKTEDNTLIGVRLCRFSTTDMGKPRWHLYRGADDHENQLLLCLMNTSYDLVERFYLIPQPEPGPRDRHLREDDPLFATGTRLSDLSDLNIASKRLAQATKLRGHEEEKS